MTTTEPQPAWRIGAGHLKALRGMIIDRDKGWRADPEMAPVIEAAIHNGIGNIDAEAFSRIYNYLWHGNLPGSYETAGYDKKQMAKAWRKYLKRYKVQSLST
jgi:hypothetical protein